MVSDPTGGRRQGRWGCPLALPESQADREQQVPMGGSPVGRSNGPCLPAVYHLVMEHLTTLFRVVVRAGEHLQTNCAGDEGEKGKRRGFKGCYLLKTLICDFIHRTPTAL